MTANPMPPDPPEGFAISERADTSPVAVETRPGWKTTEFWVVVLTNVGVLGGQALDILHLPPRYAEIGLVVVNASYAIARGLAKAGVPNAIPAQPVVTTTSSAPTSEVT